MNLADYNHKDYLEGVCSSSAKSGYERKTEDYWRQNFSGKVFEIVSSPTTSH